MAPAPPASNPRSSASALRTAAPLSFRQRTPVPKHAPYPEMIQKAIRDLAEEGGSTVAAIEEFIRKAFPDGGLPRLHRTMFPYYLRKLILDGELRESRSGRILIHGAGATRAKGTRGPDTTPATARSRLRPQDAVGVLEPKNLQNELSVLEEPEAAAAVTSSPEQVVVVNDTPDDAARMTLPKRRGRGTSKKVPVPSVEPDTKAQPEPKPRGRGRVSNKRKNGGDNDSNQSVKPETSKPPNRQVRSRKKQQILATAEDVVVIDEDNAVNEEPEALNRPKRQTRSRKQQIPATVEYTTVIDDDNAADDETEAPKRPKRQARSRKQQILAATNADDVNAVNNEVAEPEPLKQPKRQVRSRKQKIATAIEETAEAANDADESISKPESAAPVVQISLLEATSADDVNAVNNEVAEPEPLKPPKRQVRSRKQKIATAIEETAAAANDADESISKPESAVPVAQISRGSSAQPMVKRGRRGAPSRKQASDSNGDEAQSDAIAVNTAFEGATVVNVDKATTEHESRRASVPKEVEPKRRGRAPGRTQTKATEVEAQAAAAATTVEDKDDRPISADVKDGGVNAGDGKIRRQPPRIRKNSDAGVDLAAADVCVSSAANVVASGGAGGDRPSVTTRRRQASKGRKEEGQQEPAGAAATEKGQRRGRNRAAGPEKPEVNGEDGEQEAMEQSPTGVVRGQRGRDAKQSSKAAAVRTRRGRTISRS